MSHGRHRATFRRNRLAPATAIAALALGAWALPPTAAANQVFSTGCGFNPKTHFGDDEIVCAAGDADSAPPNAIFPEGTVYVTNNREWSLGDPLNDVTGPGGGNPNPAPGVFDGGAFLGIQVWLPTLARGQFDMVLDENQDGVYNRQDFVAGAGTGYAFQVGAPVGTGITTADVKALELAAGGEGQRLVQPGCGAKWVGTLEGLTKAGIAGRAHQFAQLGVTGAVFLFRNLPIPPTGGHWLSGPN